MRIALMHPTYWPEVRRGSERLIHDLGMTLAERGHEVTLLTTHPGASRESLEDGIRVRRARRPPELPRIRHYEYFAATAPLAAGRLLRGDYDLAHAFFPSCGWAAVKARRLGGPPVVFSLHGTPVREYLVARKRRLEMLQEVVAGAEQVSVLSEASAEPFRRFLLRDPTILPGGVRAGEFASEAPRAERPTVLCAASLGDPRKRGELLLRAFGRVREQLGDARLLLAGGRDPFLSRVALDLPDGVELAAAGDGEGLAGLYGSSWVSVLPAVEEAFGLVLVESLAAGTPVIAARSGACPEIVDRPALGALFEPDDEEALAAAMLEALAEPPDAERAASCRAAAGDWDWDKVVERYLAVYEQALGGGD